MIDHDDRNVDQNDRSASSGALKSLGKSVMPERAARWSPTCDGRRQPGEPDAHSARSRRSLGANDTGVLHMSTWNIDASHSTVGFSIRHLVISKVRGRFSAFSGTVELPEGGGIEGGSAKVEVQIASIDTAEPKRDGHLKSADFFDAEKFPTMTFESTKVVAKGSDFELHGKLTIRGTTKDVVLAGENLGAAKDPWGNDRVVFSAKTTISRGEFGLTWNQALETGGVLVADKVEIELDVQAVKQK
jgi:polyisoprenoid-binding protein YceI